MAKQNLTTASQITINAREVDFVTRFNDNWDALRAIMGISRPIRKSPGTKLVASKATVTLEDGAVTEGNEIPYSLAKVEPVLYDDVTILKYAKAVSIEAVNKFGAAVAIEKTDDQFLNELQNVVLSKFYTFLKNGSLTATASTWQMALAKAQGMVLNKFGAMRKSVTQVVGFANIMDFFGWIGSANITVQTMFGLTYLQNFMGYGTLFLMSNADIPAGTVIATPVDNVDLYYVDPGDSDFARLGLQYTVQGETNLIGFHAQGNYNTAVGESYALMGMTLWAEYLDGIASVDVGTEAFTAVVSPTGNPAGQKYYEKNASNEYFRTTDTTVDANKTYYTRTVTPAA